MHKADIARDELVLCGIAKANRPRTTLSHLQSSGRNEIRQLPLRFPDPSTSHRRNILLSGAVRPCPSDHHHLSKVRRPIRMLRIHSNQVLYHKIPQKSRLGNPSCKPSTKLMFRCCGQDWAMFKRKTEPWVTRLRWVEAPGGSG